MISESYIKDLLLSMGYIKKNHIYEKFFPSVDCYIKVDLKNRTIIYPEDRGMTISNRTTCNFSAPENFVVLECVTRLFDKGYRPKHLNLEKEWTLGHESKGGRADICVSDQEGNTLFIVECKTYGREYEKEYKNIVNDVLAGKNKSEWSMQISKEEIERVIKCARVHGVLPFLQECPVFMEEPYREKLFFYLKDYAYKDAQQAYAAETLFELFEKNGIYCMPLKGIRTKQFYPYPESRTMGDLDILYKEDQTKKLKQVMQDAGYKFGGYNIKHDEYEKDGVTIEMHRDVLFRLTNAYDYFADIWERAIHAKGKQYIYEMSLEDHYLHSVCHLAEHFVRGGIGIRMVLDIYILSETPRMDKAYVQRQLKALKLQKFEENIRSLAQLWFSDDEKTVRTEVSDELENYALSGGIFGSRETARRNGTVLYESKNKFVKQLVFPSYEVMKTSCPWLKTPILLPAAWLVRYKRALTASRGNIGYHIERAKTFDRVEDQEQKERCQFFERCGLEDVSENF